ncbi:MAG: hypothetical protein IJ514_02260 [Clostridia bacterium]|nr:hypothetical protein [Clostridia bacterium]
MEEKENVYGEISGAEAVAEAKEGARAQDTEALAALGKFKDVDALAKAYGSLQAEFTRRSQRLKELERQAENFKAQSAETSVGAAGLGAEKLRKKAAQKKAEEREFDSFVSELEKASGRAADGVEGVSAEEPLGERGTHSREGEESQTVADTISGEIETGTALSSERGVVATTGREPAAAVSSEELYERVKSDESVRLKIIGEYLSSLGKANAPLMRGGAGTLVAPPLKAKTIDEAGGMALRYFQKQ